MRSKMTGRVPSGSQRDVVSFGVGNMLNVFCADPIFGKQEKSRWSKRTWIKDVLEAWRVFRHVPRNVSQRRPTREGLKQKAQQKSARATRHDEGCLKRGTHSGDLPCTCMSDGAWRSARRFSPLQSTHKKTTAEGLVCLGEQVWHTTNERVTVGYTPLPCEKGLGASGKKPESGVEKKNETTRCRG